MKSKRITTSCLFVLLIFVQLFFSYRLKMASYYINETNYALSYLSCYFRLDFIGFGHRLDEICSIVLLVLLCVKKYNILLLLTICARNIIQIYRSFVGLIYYIQEVGLSSLIFRDLLYICCSLMIIVLSVTCIIPQMSKIKNRLRFLFAFPAIMKFIGHLCMFCRLSFLQDKLVVAITVIILVVDTVLIYLFCNYLKSYYKVCEIDGGIGRRLQIYEDKCVIITVPYGINDEKTIHYKDIDGIIYDITSDMSNGVLQLKTKTLNILESFFVFDKTKITIKKMNEIVSYIKKKSDCQEDSFVTTAQSISYSDNKEMNILDMINAEKRMRCSVCGHIFCYNTQDIEKNRENEKQAKSYAILGGLNAIFGTWYATHTNTSESQKYKDKIVDFSRCPKCNSTQLEDITNEKISAQETISTNEMNSSADELRKFKELLDMGAITQEEFDAKKKQILGL